MPGQRLAAALGEPVPFLVPDIRDALTKTRLLHELPIEIGARAQQSLEEKRCFHEIGAVVLAAEGQGGAAVPVHEVREHAVIAGRFLKAVQIGDEPRDGFFTFDPTAR